MLTIATIQCLLGTARTIKTYHQDLESQSPDLRMLGVSELQPPKSRSGIAYRTQWCLLMPTGNSRCIRIWGPGGGRCMALGWQFRPKTLPTNPHASGSDIAMAICCRGPADQRRGDITIHQCLLISTGTYLSPNFLATGAEVARLQSKSTTTRCLLEVRRRIAAAIVSSDN